jgi:hypothetical protein
MNADKTDLADLRGFLSQKNQIRVNPRKSVFSA